MSSLTSTFDECRKQPDGETLEQMRMHYFTDAIMNEKEPPNTGGLNIPQADAIEVITNRKKREKYTKDITFALKLLNDRLAQIQARLAQIENELVDKYGVYFADDIAAEYLDVETNKTLMLIQDDEERRHATANALNKGIENGTVDSVKIYKNTDIEEWLTVSKDYEETKLEVSQTAHDKNAQQLVSDKSVTHGTEQKANLESGFDALFSKNNSIGG